MENYDYNRTVQYNNGNKRNEKKRRGIKQFVISLLTALLLSIFVSCNCFAAARKEYSFYTCFCSKFKKTGNRLIIKIGRAGALKKNGKRVNTRKLSLKLNSSCKWTRTNVNSSKQHKNSYAFLKKEIKNARRDYVKWGEADSPGLVQIFIKGGRVFRVNVVWP